MNRLHQMKKVSLISLAAVMVPACVMGCGLDWTLPQGHFTGVEEHGYVEYWEKIGEADLGDGLVIPVNISFNSHQEASSPTLGKGWMVALLESHVEPIDENSMKVIMPDGWTFTFLRNGSTETWRGNAGWVGETKNTLFTIAAPCGWKVKFDGGKIQEIDSNKNRTLSYKYNGPVATEVDVDGKAFVQVENNTSTGVAQDLLIGGQRVDIALDRRPRVQLVGTQNLVTGFDPSLSQLRWPDGKAESFTFGTDKSLNPTLAILNADQTQRNFAWNASSGQIKTDGEWIYKLTPGDSVVLNRANGKGQMESYANDVAKGIIIVEDIDGVKTVTTTYVNAGALNGNIRNVTQIKNGVSTVLQRCDYDESGRLIRNYVLMTKPHDFTYKYNTFGKELEIDVDNKVWITKQYDAQGRLIEKDLANGIRMTYAYIEKGIRKTTFLTNGGIIIKNLNDRFQLIEESATR
jgi:YD repeat-containing protein